MIRRTFMTILGATALVAAPVAAQQTDRFTVEVSGEGGDVILIPGLASSADVWDATVARLAGHYRFHAVQVNGFAGATAGANAEGPVLGPLVEAVGAYAASLEDPALIGHSMGGLIALEVAAARPEAVGRVMIVDALPFYPLLFSPVATAEAIAPQASQMRDQILNQTDAQFEMSQTLGMQSLVKSEEARPAALEWSLQSDRRVFARAMHEIATTDARPRLAAIEAPVTVVYAWDAAMPASAAAMDRLYGAAYEGLEGVELNRIDDAFHFIMLDQPGAFAAEVEAFLE